MGVEMIGVLRRIRRNPDKGAIPDSERPRASVAGSGAGLPIGDETALHIVSEAERIRECLAVGETDQAVLRALFPGLSEVLQSHAGHPLGARAALALHPLVALRGPFEITREALDAELLAASARGDAISLAEVLSSRALELRFRGSTDEVKDCARRALDLADASDAITRGRALGCLATAALFSGDLRGAQRLGQEALEMTESGDATPEAASSRLFLAEVAALAGSERMARRALLETVSTIQTTPEPFAGGQEILRELTDTTLVEEVSRLTARPEWPLGVLTHALPLDTGPTGDAQEDALNLVETLSLAEVLPMSELIAACIELARARSFAAQGRHTDARHRWTSARQRLAFSNPFGAARSLANRAIPTLAARLWQRVTIEALSRDELWVQRDGHWFSLPRSPRVELRRRRVLQPLLLELVRARLRSPGLGLSAQDLLRAAWPDEKAADLHLLNRLYVAINSLRSMGFGDLLRSDRGYYLDPKVEVRLAR